MKKIIYGILFLSLSVISFTKSMAQTVMETPVSNEIANNDNQITLIIKDRIAADSVLKNSTLTITTTNGIVKLSGNVNSVDELSNVTQLAQSIPGVQDVDTSEVIITNGGQQPFTDSLITAKIKGMFIQKKLFTDKDIAAMSISVETNNGVVSLSGTADNQEQIDNAIKIAKSIKDVKEVKSTVTLKVN